MARIVLGGGGAPSRALPPGASGDASGVEDTAALCQNMVRVGSEGRSRRGAAGVAVRTGSGAARSRVVRLLSGPHSTITLDSRMSSTDPKSSDAYRSGFVALCGRPNVGKSTLLNALIGDRVALATRFPQTTRERMLGIWSGEEFQAVLVDTPGIHRAKSALNKFMVGEAIKGARDVDLVLMLAEMPNIPDAEAAAQWEPGPGAKAALASLVETGRPIVLVLTKCDMVKDRDLVLPIIETWQRHHDFETVVPTSAVKGKGLDVLEREVLARLPAGPAYYDREQLSDKDMRWHASEIVRGTIFAKLRDELPYACAVVVERYKETEAGDRIHATVHVDKQSQKGMVIGKKASMIKDISSQARERIGRLTGRPCQLFLDVKVSPGWTEDPKQLERLGYADHEEDRG